MADPHDSLAQVWALFRQSGVADDLAIIEHVAAVLLRQRDIQRPDARTPWPEAYQGSDLGDTARRDIENHVADAVRAVGGDNPAAHVLDPLALFRPSRAGVPGQYPTPRHVVALMHRVADVRPYHDLLDLSCGSGGFLARRRTDDLSGISVGVEIALRWARIAAANTALRLGTANTLVLQQNALAALAESPGFLDRQFDRVLMNPPFGEKVERKLMDRVRPGLSGRSETVLARLALDALKAGGRAAILLPSGPLFSNGAAETALREHMLKGAHHLRAVIALPRDSFQPYSGTQTHLLLLDRANPDEHDGRTWMFRLAQDGYVAGQSRDLTTLPDLPSDFPLLETALGAAMPTREIDPREHADVLANVWLVAGQVNETRAVEGVGIEAHPAAIIESVEWHPPSPDSPDPGETGFVLLVALSFSDATRALVVSPGAEQVNAPADVARWRADRYPPPPEGERDAASPEPHVVIYDVRRGEGEQAGGAGMVVTADGTLLGRTVPTRVVRDSLDPRPDTYITAARGTEVQASSAELIRDIRARHVEVARHLEALSDSMGTVPRASTRPVPFPREGLSVFGELSPRQERVFEAVRDWPTRVIAGEGEVPYEVVAPFSAEQVAQVLAEQSAQAGRPGDAVPLAAVHGTLRILEAMGIIVQAHLPESSEASALPYYRLATPMDAPVPESGTFLPDALP